MLVENNILVSYTPADVVDGILLIPNNIVEIAEGCGKDCFGLRVITIPRTVKKIGHMAFSDCLDLELVTFLSSDVCDISDTAFKRCPKINIIYGV